MVVLTGVSGSGKSTLAFDILFAEGQRRYLESLAPYVRQYMKILERPEVDLVTGLAPTVCAVIFSCFAEPNIQRPIQVGAALDEISRAFLDCR